MLNEVIILIPTYKKLDKLSIDEKKSLNQCYTILKKYPICIIHPFDLEIQSYKKSFNSDLDFDLLNKPFKNNYFADIAGYNDLMLSIDFYSSFQDYKYILIYQLDCWVFKDELSYWCSLNYDYIGAPMFKDFGTNENGNELDVVGNGGFSLRSTDKFIKVLSWTGNIKSFKYYFNTVKDSYKPKDFLQLLLGIFGYHNRIDYLLKFYKKKSVNEDVFFSYNFEVGSNIQIKVPDISLAIQFAFDRSPQYLYKLNHFQLPFGCHGWNRSDSIYNESDRKFWEAIIYK